ncbi:Hypothetical protein FKW44_012271, partial [Caligus rogercresseyi]
TSKSTSTTSKFIRNNCHDKRVSKSMSKVPSVPLEALNKFAQIRVFLQIKFGKTAFKSKKLDIEKV